MAMTNSESTIWSMTPGRRLVLVGNVLLMVILAAAIAFVANLISSNIHRRVDMTNTNQYALSDETEIALASLQDPVHFYVMPPPQRTQDERLPRVMERLWNLFEEYEQRTPHVRAIPVTPDRQDARALLREEFGSNYQENGWIYVVAPRDGRAPEKAHFRIQDLYDANMYGGHVINFKAEEVLTNLIRDLTRGAKRVVYYTVGHGELQAEDEQHQLGLGILTRFLKEREGVELQSVDLLKVEMVPSDCSLLLIIGAAEAFSDSEMIQLQKYLMGGGRLFYSADPHFQTGLEPLLENWGIKVNNFLVFDPRVREMGAVLVDEFGPHPINRGMQPREFYLINAVVVEPSEKKVEGLQVDGLMLVGPQVWEEQQRSQPDGFGRFTPPERKGPFPLSMIARKKIEQPIQPNRDEARIAVWGSTNSLINSFMAPREREKQYLLNHFRWLMGQESAISIPPVRDEMKPFRPKPEDMNILFLTIPIGFPLLGVLLGVGVWWRRRR